MIILLLAAAAAAPTAAPLPCQRDTTAEVQACYENRLKRRLPSPANSDAPLPVPVRWLEPWAEFSRRPALQFLSTTIAIGSLGTKPDEPRRYWFRKVTYSDRGRTAESINWADSATCPGASNTVIAMAAINMPAPAPYGGPRQPTRITMDGTNYRLTAPAVYPAGAAGTIEIQSNVGTQLAYWVEASMTVLEPCWQSAMPVDPQ
jgi:hypothetical protein